MDLVIDSTFAKLNKYKKSVNLLDGLSYSILHSKFRHFFLSTRKYNKKPKNLFISFGSAAPYRQLRDIIDILYRHHFHLTIAPGFTLKKNNIKTLRRIYPKIKFTGKKETLARNFFKCDVALISSGITIYCAIYRVFHG